MANFMTANLRAQSFPALTNTVLSHLFREYLRENEFIYKTIF